MIRSFNANAIWAGLSLSAFISSAMGCHSMAVTGHNQSGVTAYHEGRYDVALHHFQLAADSDPRNADSVYNMARVTHEIASRDQDSAKHTQAETYYNQCLDVDENHVSCYRGLATLLVETGREDAAFRLMKNWSARNPRLAAPRIELARLCEEFGDKDTALLHLNQAIALEGDNKRAWAAIANLREQNGDYSQALANYQKAQTLDGSQPGIASRIAKLRRATSNSIGLALPNGGTRIVSPQSSGPRY